jgi:hypothetical protein
LGPLEKVNVQSDLETLQFAEKQLKQLTSMMAEIANQNEQITDACCNYLAFGVVTAVTVWAAIGDIHRFEDAQHLVGYAGLGTKVHDSGMTTRTGRITKAGRRDLRVALTEAAQVAANSHPHWKAELARLQPRLGRNKAIVAIARKLLVAVWYIWRSTKRIALHNPKRLPRSFEVCLPTRKRKSSQRTVRCSVRSPAPGCVAARTGTDQHCLGFEETHPTATLQRPTACVTRGWAGRDNAILTEPTSSHANCLKTRRLPPVGCTLC